jgi:hypothetical protein
MRMATSSSTRPGMAGLSTRSSGRRPKSAKARNRGLWAAAVPRVLWGLYERGHCQALSSFAFALSFVRPRRRLSSAPTVDFRRRRAQKLSKSAVALAIEAHFDVSRPRLDSFEHGGRLDDRGPKERSVVEFLPLLSLFASGPCRLRVQRRCPMARAMIASAYIRQPPFRLATLLHAWTIAQVGRGSSLTR